MTFKLLIVDDSEPIRTRLCSLLEGVPGIAALDQAATLSEALVSVRRSPPTMLILDLNLPDGSGLEIIDSLKQMAPTLLIAVLTFYGHCSYRDRCLHLGADWFFDKGTEFELLLEVVHQQVARKSSRSLTVQAAVNPRAIYQ